MDDLLGDFLSETGESLDLLDAELVRFEREPDNADMLNAIFRLVHTVKGTCGFLGLPRLAKLAHAAETLMGQYRDGAPVTAEGVSLILESIDRIKQILAELERQGAEPSGSDAELIAALEGLAEGQRDLPRPAVDASPAADADGVSQVNAAGTAVRQQTVRVNVDTLEQLMTTVSELVLTRNQLLEIVRRNGDNVFRAPLQRLSSVTADLQDGIMKARLQPVANAWQNSAAARPRIVARSRQEDRARAARRRHRARPAGAGADQGPADAHGPQLRRPWHRERGGAPRARQARHGAHRPQRLSARRSYRHRGRR